MCVVQLTCYPPNFARNLGDSLTDSRWLLPDNQKTILNYDFLESEDQETVLAILYEIYEGANNNSIYLSRPNGEAFTSVISNVNRRMGPAIVDGNYIVIFYVKEGVVHSARIEVSSFSVSNSTTLPIIE